VNFESPVFSGMRVCYVRARDSVLLIQVEILQLRNSDLLVFDESSQNVNRYEPCRFHVEGLRLLLRITVAVMGLVSSGGERNAPAFLSSPVLLGDLCSRCS